MLFKLFCIAGFTILMLIYLCWYSKFWTDEDFPGMRPERKASPADSSSQVNTPCKNPCHAPLHGKVPCPQPDTGLRIFYRVRGIWIFLLKAKHNFLKAHGGKGVLLCPKSLKQA